MGLPYILFICSAVDGQLGCFHFLAIINNVDMNICVDVCFHFFWIYTYGWNCWVI